MIMTIDNLVAMTVNRVREKLFHGSRFTVTVHGIFAATAIFMLVFFSPGDSEAFPFFARQVGRDCTYCHSAFPKLNEKGRAFRSSGYRFDAEGEWKEVKDITSIPASFEMEVEGAYNRTRSGGVYTESSDMVIEEAEIIAGGAFGKTGKVSSLVMVAVEEAGAGFETSLHKAFIQINDLAGETGSGLVNARAGQWQIGLPFLSPSEGAISNQYLAESVLGILALDQKAIEVNGFIEGDAEGFSPSQRYSIGVAREDVNGDDKMQGLYASYAATFEDFYSLGGIWKGGKEKDGVKDSSYNKYGIAGQAEGKDIIITGGYFLSDRNSGVTYKDYLFEALYKPVKAVWLGGRFESVKEDKKPSLKSHTLMARYNMLSSAYAQFEYRGLRDSSGIKGANDREGKVRVFLTALF